MVHNMKLKPSPFERIKSGKKTIEIRLYDEKRRLVNINDIIEFTNMQTNEVIKVKVIKLHLFKTFKELFDNFDKSFFGHNENDIISYERMYDYYTKEEELKYGVVGIEIKLLKDGE